MRSSRAAAALCAAGLLVAACSSDDAASTTSSTEPAPSTTSSPASTTAPPASTEPVTFRLTITNVSDGSDTPTPLAPGLVLLHDPDAGALFEPGAPQDGRGLESLAEDGDPTPLAEAVGAETFQAEEGGYEAGPLLPGDAFVVELVATPGQHLTFANMFGQSNDWFFATVPGGIALFDAAGAPIPGDATSQVALWDAGTEVDQPIGEGPDQAPRQDAPGQGAPDPDDTVRMVRGADGLVTVELEVVG